MKRIYSLFSALLGFVVLFSTIPAYAQSNFGLVAGYAKGNNHYDIVAKENPNTKLKLYINDKNAIKATANKKGWATFKKVTLGNTDKLSFTEIQTKNGKTHERPINYVRIAAVSGYKVSFSVAPKARVPKPVETQALAPAPQPAQPKVTPAPTPDPQLSNNNTYTNSDGNAVHSPASTTDGSIPEGATAKCVDGTYSFSQHRSGTCSRHGGVSSWL